eukprot:Amastigsp_a1293_24.p1 type:complete len:142 gc:universal Amastigsp_a1293_24:63-488(+)
MGGFPLGWLCASCWLPNDRRAARTLEFACGHYLCARCAMNALMRSNGETPVRFGGAGCACLRWLGCPRASPPSASDERSQVVCPPSVRNAGAAAITDVAVAELASFLVSSEALRQRLNWSVQGVQRFGRGYISLARQKRDD